MNPPLPTGEGERLESLRQYDILDASTEQEFDDLTHLAAHICGTPISLISLVDHERQWFKSSFGLEAVEIPRDVFFCAHAIIGDDLLIIPDAAADERFANNALVAGEPHIRFYAGAPLVTPEGQAIGTLCVIDTVPRQLDEAQQDALRRLARQAVALLEARPQDLPSHSRQARLQADHQRGLQESQSFLQSTLDALSSHIAVLDENGKIIAVNKAWRQFLEQNDGTPISCGVGANYVEVCRQAKGNWAEEAPEVIQGILEVMAGRKQSFYLEYPCHSPQEERWFNVSVTRFAGEIPVRAVVAHDNITQRKQAEEKLRQSEANLAKAQQIARLGSWELDLISLKDPNASSLRWSDEVFRIFGYQPGQIEVSRENFFRAVHPDDRERIMTAMTQAVSEGKAYSLDHRILLPDGGQRIVHEQSEMVLDERTGKPLKMVGTVQDITEPKQTEARLSLLVQGLNQVVAVTDELLSAPDLDALLCQAVELARTKLGLERCSIYLLRPEHDEMRGTYGTDAQGQTSDERDFCVSMREHWVAPLLGGETSQSDTRRWFVKQTHDLVAKDMGSENTDMRSLGKTGWIAATPIFSLQGPIGVLFNDTAISDSPIDTIVQELVVIYCSLLGNIIERKQAEEALRQSHDELERRVAERTTELKAAIESLQVKVVERQMAMDALHQTAEAFRATQEMLQLVMDHIPQAIFWKDRNSVFLGCNYRLALNLGLSSPEEIKGKTDFDFTPAAYASAYQSDDKQVMETDTAKLNIEEPSFKADGSPAWLRTNKIPLHDSEDHVVGLLGTYEDITEQKEAEAALHAAREEADAANRAKSEFLSRMSHELRTPLNAILGFGQILESEDLGPVSQESVGYILKGGRHLLGLINEVLDISRVEAGRLDLSLEPIDLDKMLFEVCALVRPLAAERNISLDENTLGLKHGFILADHQGIKQVLINLLSNAIKYNREGGEVEVSCIPKPGGWIAIAIHDTGPGIEPQDMQKLFTPFERLSAANSAIEGTGLGLVLSQRLVTAMGGTLKVESTLGQGTTFTVELPQTISPEEQMTDMPEALSYLAMNKKIEGAYSVLCIEDNPSNLRLMEAIFESRPEVRLLTALQGSIGLDMARQHAPDLILLDLNLPDMHGKEVLSRLQESARTKEIPVVVVSADATPKQVERLMAAGARAYLTKPLNISQFLKTLDELLHPTPES
jgi:PAS domain S-box-containing protein